MKDRVLIDVGYDLAECWTPARVIARRKSKSLFDDKDQESLLVETLGGERLWVDSWKTM